LIIDGEEFLFSGEVEGAISSACIGEVQDEGVRYVRQPSVDFGGLSSCCR
jgi:hypothetical protein